MPHTIHQAGHLINRAAVRRLAIDLARQMRPAIHVSAVGAEVYAALDATVRQRIRGLIDQHPSGFRTLRA